MSFNLLRTTEAKNIVRSNKDFVKVLYTKDPSLTIIPHFEKWQHRPKRFSLENRQSPRDEFGERGLPRALKVGGLWYENNGRFPFNKNSGLKFRKFRVLNGTVHSGCTDPTQATARFVIVASQHTHNYALKVKSKYCLYPKEHSTVENGRWKTKSGGMLSCRKPMNASEGKKFLWIEAIRFSKYSNDSKQFLESYGK